jgi:hypothetical protein
LYYINTTVQATAEATEAKLPNPQSSDGQCQFLATNHTPALFRVAANRHELFTDKVFVYTTGSLGTPGLGAAPDYSTGLKGILIFHGNGAGSDFRVVATPPSFSTVSASCTVFLPLSGTSMWSNL